MCFVMSFCLARIYHWLHGFFVLAGQFPHAYRAEVNKSARRVESCWVFAAMETDVSRAFRIVSVAAPASILMILALLI